MYTCSRGVSDPRDGSVDPTGVWEGGRSRPGCYRYSQPRAAKDAARYRDVRSCDGPKSKESLK